MARIEPVSIENAPEGSKPTMEAIKANFGKVPNIFATLAHSPTALNSLMGLFGTLESGELKGIPHEAIALYIGQQNDCKYCIAAHTAKAKMAGASEEDAIGFRKGKASDPKIQTLLDFTGVMVARHGISDDELKKFRDAGLSDADMLEAIAIIVCNIFTNATNALAQTDIDFPAAPEID